MRYHHHDLRDMGLAFSLGFDLRRVLVMSVAASWTLAVVGLFFVAVSWRVSGHDFSGSLTGERLAQSWTIFTDTRLSVDRVLLWAGMLGFWWMGFARIVAPVQRSIALEVARDERLDSKQLNIAARRLGGLAAAGPVAGLFLVGLLFLVVVVWAFLAKIPGLTGSISSALTLPLTLAAALVGAIVLLVVVAAIPLMIPAAVVECRDLMDVISRACSYVVQRPLRYLAGLIMKKLVVVASAALGLLVLGLAWAMVAAALWLVGEGALATQLITLVLRDGGEIPVESQVTVALFGGVFYGSALLTLGWLMTVSAATDVILYMLLRYEVDGVTFDEIMIPQEHLAQHGVVTAADTMALAQAAQDTAQSEADAALKP